ncbi:hypothetical protein BST61_g11007 [Cercospora zeina]
MASIGIPADLSRISPSKYHENVPIDPQQQTRLLILLPGAGSEQIACNLLRHDLRSTTDATSHAEAHYEALSYVWGHGETPVKICVNNIGGYEVTPNLAKALRNLRQPGEEWRLSDLLAKIFGQARDVVVWLGETSAGTDLSFVQAKKENGLRAFWKRKKQSDDVARAISASTEHISPWWTRSWVLEEYALAWRDPVALVGRQRISFQELMLNMWPSTMLAMLPGPSFFGDGNFSSMAFFLRHTNTKEAHDKVFCIVTSLPEKQQSLISRDYKVPESTVFAQATVADIRATGTLAILALVSRGASTPLDYPTWAVDFIFRQQGRIDEISAMEGLGFQVPSTVGQKFVREACQSICPGCVLPDSGDVQEC